MVVVVIVVVVVAVVVIVAVVVDRVSVVNATQTTSKNRLVLSLLLFPLIVVLLQLNLLCFQLK